MRAGNNNRSGSSRMISTAAGATESVGFDTGNSSVAMLDMGGNSSVGMDGNSKTAEIAKTFAAIPTALMRIDAACREASLTIAQVCNAHFLQNFLF